MRMSLKTVAAIGLGVLGFSVGVAADGAAGLAIPKPRPRLTDAQRVSAEMAPAAPEGNRALLMEKLVIREKRLPAGPLPEVQREGKFNLTQGGFVLKKVGKTFSTDIGLWRHIDILPDSHSAPGGVRMGFLRFSW